MSDKKLLDAYHARNAMWRRIGSVPAIPIRDLSPPERSSLEQSHTEYWRLDALITAELLARGKPAQLDGVTLHLTGDRLNFVVLNPATNAPLGCYPTEAKMWTGHLLFRYPADCA